MNEFLSLLDDRMMNENEGLLGAAPRRLLEMTLQSGTQPECERQKDKR